MPKTKVLARRAEYSMKKSPAKSKSKKSKRKWKLTFRSNLKSVVDLINQLELKDKHVDVLRKMPFWLIIDACRKKKLEGSTCVKKDDFVEKIIATYSGKGCFMISGKNIKLVKEVKSIFGIQCGEQQMEVVYASKQDISFVKRNKLKGEKLTATSIKNMIQTKVKSSRKQDVEDVARLICIFLCLSKH